MSVTVDRLLIVQLTNWLNEHRREIPLPERLQIQIDRHSDSGQQIWLQPLSGTTEIKRYTNGSYIGQIPFAIYYQERNPANMASLDVPLWNIAEFFEQNRPNIPIAEITRVAMTGTPNAFSREESKTYVNQAVFQLTYRKDVQYGGE